MILNHNENHENRYSVSVIFVYLQGKIPDPREEVGCCWWVDDSDDDDDDDGIKIGLKIILCTKSMIESVNNWQSCNHNHYQES